jgi:hypothetical protein
VSARRSNIPGSIVHASELQCSRAMSRARADFSPIASTQRGGDSMFLNFLRFASSLRARSSSLVARVGLRRSEDRDPFARVARRRARRASRGAGRFASWKKVKAGAPILLYTVYTLATNATTRASRPAPRSRSPCAPPRTCPR